MKNWVAEGIASDVNDFTGGVIIAINLPPVSANGGFTTLLHAYELKLKMKL